jgi:hypothetical protein
MSHASHAAARRIKGATTSSLDLQNIDASHTSGERLFPNACLMRPKGPSALRKSLYTLGGCKGLGRAFDAFILNLNAAHRTAYRSWVRPALKMLPASIHNPEFETLDGTKRAEHDAALRRGAVPRCCAAAEHHGDTRHRGAAT